MTDAAPHRLAVHTADAPAAIGPYSQAIIAGGQVWISGQIALCPTTGVLVGETAAAQAEQALTNLRAVLTAAGASVNDLVRCTLYLKDLNDFEAVNAVYARAMPEPPPARACVEVSRLPRDALFEIDAIASLPR